MQRVDVTVIGGGAIGLGVAWRLARAGRDVLVLERETVGRGATWAAAGMLAPDAELGFEELDLYALTRESARRWPAFTRELEAESGTPVGYNDAGTILAADDRDSAAALRRRFRFLTEHGARVEWLDADAALDLEPLLSPRLPSAVWAPDDHQVDNRAVALALAEAARRAGATICEHAPVTSVEPDAEAPAIVLADGTRIASRVVILAAGAWSRHVGGLTPAPPVRPVAGQALALAAPTEALALRHVVRGPRAYLVPKADRVVVGATSEERGDDAPPTAGGAYRLLDGAVRVVPAVEEWTWIETWTGLRPASRDHAPLLGDGPPGVVYATGHYRHGLLLLPVTADEVAALVDARLDGRDESRPLLAPFAPARFAAGG